MHKKVSNLKKKNRSIQVGIRFTEEEFAPYKSAAEKLGLSNAELLRAVLLNNFDPKIHDKKTRKDIKKLLFYFNKASNNINQLAKVINTQAKTSNIDTKKLIQFYSKLNRIYDSFENGIEHAKKSSDPR